MGLSPFERADDVATSSFPSLDNDYEHFFHSGKDEYSVLRRPVTFDADVDPTFDAARAVDEKKDKEIGGWTSRTSSSLRRGWQDGRRTNKLLSGAAAAATAP